MSKLPKVGSCRISRDLKTLVLSVDSGFGSKVYLLSVAGVFDLAGGYLDFVNVVEGKVYENTSMVEVQTS